MMSHQLFAISILLGIQPPWNKSGFWGDAYNLYQMQELKREFNEAVDTYIAELEANLAREEEYKKEYTIDF